MSFLAQLRQQKAGSGDTGLQLCYLLHIDGQQRLRLGLYLAVLAQGELSDHKQVYCVQRQHLVMPPPFLAPADTPILTQLLQQSECWLTGGDNELPQCAETGGGSSLHSILATGKCFVQARKGLWCRLSLGQRQVIEPYWKTCANGEQKVSWKLANASRTARAQLWQAGGQQWMYCAQNHQLAPTQPSVDGQALTLLSAQRPLQPEQVMPFLQAQGPLWQQYGLPLPQALTQVTLEADVRPLLILRNASDEKGRQRDELVLAYRYISERVCAMSGAHERPASQHIWSGNELLTLPVDQAQEQRWREKLHAFTKPFTATAKAGVWTCANKKLWRQLLLNDRRKLETLGFSFLFEESFKHHYVAPDDWQVDLQQQGQQWQLGMSFLAEGQRVDVFDLLKQLRMLNRDLAQHEIELQLDGRILVLPSEVVGSLAEELADLLEYYKSDAPLPLNQIYRIDALRKHLPDSTHWCGGEALQEQAINLHSSPVMLERNSCDVRADLRPYQWLGVCWLQHLAANGFNGLLADDMGLGKTLQTLAHLSLEQKKGRLEAPALIVAPTSLLANWQNELHRFCPQLSCRVLHGQNRHQWWQQNERCDVLITSYHLVVRDIEQWQGLSLSWLILDEAQVIKNARTQVSKAVRELQAQHRLCLSGTPVENHLGELWSLLDFLEPGVLGSQGQFVQYYKKPIEQDGLHSRLQQLLARTAPFMLRRTKTQVAKDLPPKTVMQQSIVFDDKQQAFYQQLKTEGWKQLKEQLDDAESAGQKQILLLTALTKLRQACCDPLLLGEQDVPSAKTQYCLQMLQELAAENRAVLVFSQFTKVLDILACELQKLELSYLMLTGQTKNRAQLVEAFQRGDAPVFLISLKAGGVGLNLTRADTVVHFDPWWNASAEDQAADRAHRIGQTQPVFVYKLIAQDTIEEKIARLQQAKAGISSQVNQSAQSTGESFALKLEDLLALWQEEN